MIAAVGASAISAQAPSNFPVIYAQPNYQGPAMAIQQDWAGNSDWEGNPHRIRSILVPAGWRITIYRERNFRGGENTLTSSVSWDSPGQVWNGTTRSIRVFPPAIPPPSYVFPTIYSQMDFNGPAMAIQRDWAGSKDWEGKPHRVRSLRVPQGWYVVVYEKRNFRGKSFQVNDSWTPQPGDWWYGRIKSIRVTSGTPPKQPR